MQLGDIVSDIEGIIQNAAWHWKGAENNGKANQLLSGVLRKRSGKVSFLFGIIVPYNYNEFKMNKTSGTLCKHCIPCTKKPGICSIKF